MDQIEKLLQLRFLCAFAPQGVQIMPTAEGGYVAYVRELGMYVFSTPAPTEEVAISLVVGYLTNSLVLLFKHIKNTGINKYAVALKDENIKVYTSHLENIWTTVIAVDGVRMADIDGTCCVRSSIMDAYKMTYFRLHEEKASVEAAKALDHLLDPIRKLAVSSIESDLNILRC